MSLETTASLSPLLKLYQFLESLGLRANWRGQSDSQPFEQVIVSLDPQETAPERYDYLLQIAFAEDLQAGFQERETRFENGATLLFSLVLPVQIPAELLLTAYGLLAQLNRILPLGHLALNEGHQPAAVYFKYALLGLNPAFSMLLVLSVIETLSAFVLLLTPELQAFSQRQFSADECLEKIESQLLENARQLFVLLQQASENEPTASA